MLIAEAAVFYSRLSKWEDHFGGLAPCPAPMLLYYHFSLRSLSAEHANCVVVDVGETLDKKIAAIACYESQFATRPELLERIRVFNRQQGMAAGLSAGEVVFSPAPLATRDLIGLVLGPPS
jgi:LmbE family N-acetylglucosaminyl deacetylase